MKIDNYWERHGKGQVNLKRNTCIKWCSLGGHKPQRQCTLIKLENLSTSWICILIWIFPRIKLLFLGLRPIPTKNIHIPIPKYTFVQCLLLLALTCFYVDQQAHTNYNNSNMFPQKTNLKLSGNSKAGD